MNTNPEPLFSKLQVLRRRTTSTFDGTGVRVVRAFAFGQLTLTLDRKPAPVKFRKVRDQGLLESDDLFKV